jgi:predicted transcriptional regulator
MGRFPNHRAKGRVVATRGDGPISRLSAAAGQGILGRMELGPLEERVLDVLWRSPHGVSVREVRRTLGDGLAYTTVMTTLDRLFKKGLLDRRLDGRAFRYAARTSRESMAAGVFRRWLDRLLDRGPARPLLASLVEAVGEHDRALLPELTRLVREKERAARRGVRS